MTHRRAVGDGADHGLSLGLEILEALSGRALTLRDLAARIGCHRNTLRRSLTPLLESGWVGRDAHDRYTLTTRAWSVGIRSLTGIDQLRTCLHPLLVELAVHTGESASLVVYEAGEAVHVDRVDPGRPLTAHTALGRRAPAYAVAPGKVLLAADPAEADRVARGPLRRFTPTTLCDPNLLRAELAAVARNGYAENRGEHLARRGGVAAPVRVPGIEARAAVGLSGPVERIALRREALVAVLMEAVGRRPS